MKIALLSLAFLLVSSAWSAAPCKWALSQYPYVRLVYLSYQQGRLTPTQIHKIEQSPIAVNPFRLIAKNEKTAVFKQAFEDSVRSSEQSWAEIRISLKELLLDLEQQSGHIAQANAATRSVFSPHTVANFKFHSSRITENWIRERSGRFLIATNDSAGRISFSNMFTGEKVWELPCRLTPSRGLTSGLVNLLLNDAGDLQVVVSNTDAQILTSTIGDTECRKLEFPLHSANEFFNIHQFDDGQKLMVLQDEKDKPLEIYHPSLPKGSFKFWNKSPQALLKTTDGRLLSIQSLFNGDIQLIQYFDDRPAQMTIVAKGMKRATASLYQTQDGKIFAAYGNEEKTSVLRLFSPWSKPVDFTGCGQLNSPILHESKGYGLTLAFLSSHSKLLVYTVDDQELRFQFEGIMTNPQWTVGPDGQDFMVTRTRFNLFLFSPMAGDNLPIAKLDVRQDFPGHDKIVDVNGVPHLLTEREFRIYNFSSLFVNAGSVK